MGTEDISMLISIMNETTPLVVRSSLFSFSGHLLTTDTHQKSTVLRTNIQYTNDNFCFSTGMLDLPLKKAKRSNVQA